jgi:hypothetical protein
VSAKVVSHAVTSRSTPTKVNQSNMEDLLNERLAGLMKRASNLQQVVDGVGRGHD